MLSETRDTPQTGASAGSWYTKILLRWDGGTNCGMEPAAVFARNAIIRVMQIRRMGQCETDSKLLSAGFSDTAINRPRCRF